MVGGGGWTQQPGWQLLGVGEPSVLVSATFVPTSKFRVETFPIAGGKFLSVGVFYSSIRLMGVSLVDAYEKVGAGVRLYPAFYTFQREAGEENVTGHRYLSVMPFVGVEGRHHRQNSFLVDERGALRITDQRSYKVSREYGMVVTGGVRVLYGGRKLGVGTGVALDVGYLYARTLTYEENAQTGTLTYQQEWKRYINLGEFVLSAVLVLGKIEK